MSGRGNTRQLPPPPLSVSPKQKGCTYSSLRKFPRAERLFQKKKIPPSPLLFGNFFPEQKTPPPPPPGRQETPFSLKTLLSAPISTLPQSINPPFLFQRTFFKKENCRFESLRTSFFFLFPFLRNLPFYEIFLVSPNNVHHP